MNTYQHDAILLLDHSFRVAPEDVEMIPLTPTRVARKNDKRPARAEVILPDDWVKNIKGYKDLQDVYVMSRVPRELWQNWRNTENKKKDLNGNAELNEHVLVKETTDQD